MDYWYMTRKKAADKLLIDHKVTAVLFQIWHVADVPEGDKFQYTHFAHKINSFDTAPRKLLASDSRLRPDRYALEKGDLSKAGSEKSRSISLLAYFFFFLFWNTDGW